jgi:hypothetical protein
VEGLVLGLLQNFGRGWHKQEKKESKTDEFPGNLLRAFK